jgi:hypothetical protein
VSTSNIKAGYLPGLTDADVAWHSVSFGSGAEQLDVDMPMLSPAQLTAMSERVRTHSAVHLQSLSTAQIIDIISRAIARLLDKKDVYRIEAERLLPRLTGLAPDMLSLSLSAYLKTFRKPQLQRFVAEDFPNPAQLESFTPRSTGGWSKAVAPDLLVHVWAGNVPGLPLWSLISGLLVRAGNIGKVSSAEPLMASWFARLIVEVEPSLKDCLAVVWWPRDDTTRPAALFSQAEAVLAYGGNQSLDQIRQQVPASTRFLPHGHKLSFAIVSQSALTVRQAQNQARFAALDVARYEQQGCYSPHTIYVARGGAVSPREFAQLLAGELAALEHRFPRRTLLLEDAVSLAKWRQAKEFESVQHSDSSLIGDATAPWAVAYSELPTSLAPSAMNRTVCVVAVDQMASVIRLIAGQKMYLQSAGVAASPEELFVLASELGAAGVTRICAIGAMTAPEAGWHHDGRFSLLDLVRMVDIEATTEHAAEAFTSYRD